MRVLSLDKGIANKTVNYMKVPSILKRPVQYDSLIAERANLVRSCLGIAFTAYFSVDTVI